MACRVQETGWGARGKAKRRLFMTVIPRYFTNRVVKEAENRDYEIASMNDESRFGPEFHIIEMVGAVSPLGPLQRSISCLRDRRD